MASTDEEVISESETQHPNDATYIYPIAPKLKKEVVGEVDANTMPAFQCLDEVNFCFPLLYQVFKLVDRFPY